MRCGKDGEDSAIFQGREREVVRLTRGRRAGLGKKGWLERWGQGGVGLGLGWGSVLWSSKTFVSCWIWEWRGAFEFIKSGSIGMMVIGSTT